MRQTSQYFNTTKKIIFYKVKSYFLKVICLKVLRAICLNYSINIVIASSRKLHWSQN